MAEKNKENPGNASGAPEMDRTVEELGAIQDLKGEIVRDVTAQIEENVEGLVGDVSQMLRDGLGVLAEKQMPVLAEGLNKIKEKVTDVENLAARNKRRHNLKFMFTDKSFTIWFILSAVCCTTLVAGMIYWYQVGALRTLAVWLGTAWLGFLSAFGMILLAPSAVKGLANICSAVSEFREERRKKAKKAVKSEYNSEDLYD